jgi:hypothetical protein
VVAASLTQLPHRCTHDSGKTSETAGYRSRHRFVDLTPLFSSAGVTPAVTSRLMQVVVRRRRPRNTAMWCRRRQPALRPELGSGGGLSLAKHFRAQIKSSPVNPALQRPNRTARGASDFLIAPLFDGNQAKGLLLVPG